MFLVDLFNKFVTDAQLCSQYRTSGWKTIDHILNLSKQTVYWNKALDIPPPFPTPPPPNKCLLYQSMNKPMCFDSRGKSLPRYW